MNSSDSAAKENGNQMQHTSGENDKSPEMTTIEEKSLPATVVFDKTHLLPRSRVSVHVTMKDTQKLPKVQDKQGETMSTGNTKGKGKTTEDHFSAVDTSTPKETGPISSPVIFDRMHLLPRTRTSGYEG